MSGIHPPRVPEGLRSLMKNFTKDMLKEKPPNIYDFSAQYFEAMVLNKKDFKHRGFEGNSSCANVFENSADLTKIQVPLSIIYSVIPEELTELIKDFIKAVLRNNPHNICEFAVEYFRTLKEQRGNNNGVVKYPPNEDYLKSAQYFPVKSYSTVEKEGNRDILKTKQIPQDEELVTHMKKGKGQITDNNKTNEKKKLKFSQKETVTQQLKGNIKSDRDSAHPLLTPFEFSSESGTQQYIQNTTAVQDINSITRREIEIAENNDKLPHHNEIRKHSQNADISKQETKETTSETVERDVLWGKDKTPTENILSSKEHTIIELENENDFKARDNFSESSDNTSTDILVSAEGTLKPDHGPSMDKVTLNNQNKSNNHEQSPDISSSRIDEQSPSTLMKTPMNSPIDEENITVISENENDAKQKAKEESSETIAPEISTTLTSKDQITSEIKNDFKAKHNFTESSNNTSTDILASEESNTSTHILVSAESTLKPGHGTSMDKVMVQNQNKSDHYEQSPHVSSSRVDEQSPSTLIKSANLTADLKSPLKPSVNEENITVISENENDAKRKAKEESSETIASEISTTLTSKDQITSEIKNENDFKAKHNFTESSNNTSTDILASEESNTSTHILVSAESTLKPGHGTSMDKVMVHNQNKSDNHEQSPHVSSSRVDEQSPSTLIKSANLTAALKSPIKSSVNEENITVISQTEYDAKPKAKPESSETIGSEISTTLTSKEQITSEIKNENDFKAKHNFSESSDNTSTDILASEESTLKPDHGTSMDKVMVHNQNKSDNHEQSPHVSSSRVDEQSPSTLIKSANLTAALKSPIKSSVNEENITVISQTEYDAKPKAKPESSETIGSEISTTLTSKEQITSEIKNENDFKAKHNFSESSDNTSTDILASEESTLKPDHGTSMDKVMVHNQNKSDNHEQSPDILSPRVDKQVSSTLIKTENLTAALKTPMSSSVNEENITVISENENDAKRKAKEESSETIAPEICTTSTNKDQITSEIKNENDFRARDNFSESSYNTSTDILVSAESTLKPDHGTSMDKVMVNNQNKSNNHEQSPDILSPRVDKQVSSTLIKTENLTAALKTPMSSSVNEENITVISENENDAKRKAKEESSETISSEISTTLTSKDQITSEIKNENDFRARDNFSESSYNTSTDILVSAESTLKPDHGTSMDKVMVNNQNKSNNHEQSPDILSPRVDKQVSSTLIKTENLTAALKTPMSSSVNEENITVISENENDAKRKAKEESSETIASEISTTLTSKDQITSEIKNENDFKAKHNFSESSDNTSTDILASEESTLKPDHGTSMDKVMVHNQNKSDNHEQSPHVSSSRVDEQSPSTLIKSANLTAALKSPIKSSVNEENITVISQTEYDAKPKAKPESSETIGSEISTTLTSKDQITSEIKNENDFRARDNFSESSYNTSTDILVSAESTLKPDHGTSMDKVMVNNQNKSNNHEQSPDILSPRVDKQVSSTLIKTENLTAALKTPMSSSVNEENITVISENENDAKRKAKEESNNTSTDYLVSAESTFKPDYGTSFDKVMVSIQTKSKNHEQSPDISSSRREEQSPNTLIKTENSTAALKSPMNSSVNEENITFISETENDAKPKAKPESSQTLAPEISTTLTSKDQITSEIKNENDFKAKHNFSESSDNTSTDILASEESTLKPDHGTSMDKVMVHNQKKSDNHEESPHISNSSIHEPSPSTLIKSANLTAALKSPLKPSVNEENSTVISENENDAKRKAKERSSSEESKKSTDILASSEGTLKPDHGTTMDKVMVNNQQKSENLEKSPHISNSSVHEQSPSNLMKTPMNSPINEENITVISENENDAKRKAKEESSETIAPEISTTLTSKDQNTSEIKNENDFKTRENFSESSDNTSTDILVSSESTFIPHHGTSMDEIMVNNSSIDEQSPSTLMQSAGITTALKTPIKSSVNGDNITAISRTENDAKREAEEESNETTTSEMTRDNFSETSDKTSTDILVSSESTLKPDNANGSNGRLVDTCNEKSSLMNTPESNADKTVNKALLNRENGQDNHKQKDFISKSLGDEASINSLAAETETKDIEQSDLLTESKDGKIDHHILDSHEASMTQAVGNFTPADNIENKKFKQAYKYKDEYIGRPLNAPIAEIYLKSFKTENTSPWYLNENLVNEIEHVEVLNNISDVENEGRTQLDISIVDQIKRPDSNETDSLNESTFEKDSLEAYSSKETDIDEDSLESGSVVDNKLSQKFKNNSEERMPTYLYGIQIPEQSVVKGPQPFKRSTAFIIPIENNKPAYFYNNNNNSKSTNISMDDLNNIKSAKTDREQSNASDQINNKELFLKTNTESLTNIGQDKYVIPQNEQIEKVSDSSLQTINEVNEQDKECVGADCIFSENESYSSSSWTDSREDERFIPSSCAENMFETPISNKEKQLNTTQTKLQGGIYEIGISKNSLEPDEGLSYIERNTDDENNHIDLIKESKCSISKMQNDSFQNDFFKKLRAAIIIQRAYRTFRAKDHINSNTTFEQKILQNLAATKIQREFRKYIQRKTDKVDVMTAEKRLVDKAYNTQICMNTNSDIHHLMISEIDTEILNNNKIKLIPKPINKTLHSEEKNSVHGETNKMEVAATLIQNAFRIFRARKYTRGTDLRSSHNLASQLSRENSSEFTNPKFQSNSAIMNKASWFVGAQPIELSPDLDQHCMSVDRSDSSTLNDISATGNLNVTENADNSKINEDVLNFAPADNSQSPAELSPSSRSKDTEISIPFERLPEIAENYDDYNLSFDEVASKLRDHGKLVEKMQQQRLTKGDYFDTELNNEVRNKSFEEPIILAMQKLQQSKKSTPDSEDENVIVNQIDFGNTRESSAFSDSIIIDQLSYEEIQNEIFNNPSISQINLKRHATIEHESNNGVKHIKMQNNIKCKAEGSLYLDDSLESDDCIHASFYICGSEPVDFNGISTDTESTIIVNLTKPQSTRIKESESIDESLETFVEESAAKTIQTAYRNYHRNKLLKRAETTARRMTLQRGNAIQNISITEEDKPFCTNSGQQSETVHKPSSKAIEVRETSTTNYKLKWISLRQNSLPVQIDSEIFRVIPKHMRKRIQSAGDKKREYKH
ncbi:unnamed protein product [Ceratitis capitata]|uniref:(Mediterranean fruit fly) hypothetical protein n=1 Tax=Ceratitis capitata TaxID=7213 RepID=A0A811U7E5_CERCA|nr:unnamed protein product [Ceratitis capitata]